ncbi:hypothetical protein [Clostridium sp. UBA1652]|uniref:hypothetical protein n=1 Tax=Clostridium sp. UBA1652 TaxID=1946348 RepID=UPI002580047D|nr:hypothetical protein [Clostridium sp. UBA1652]
MITITNKDLETLKNELSETLFKLSFGKLNYTQANNIANTAIDNIDFENSALVHKGVNWYAKQILEVIDFEKIA